MRKTGSGTARAGEKLAVFQAEGNVYSFHTFVRKWKRCTSAVQPALQPAVLASRGSRCGASSLAVERARKAGAGCQDRPPCAPAGGAADNSVGPAAGRPTRELLSARKMNVTDTKMNGEQEVSFSASSTCAPCCPTNRSRRPAHRPEAGPAPDEVRETTWPPASAAANANPKSPRTCRAG